MKLIKQTALGGAIKLFTVGERLNILGDIVATFSNDENGKTAYGLFCDAFAKTPGAVLYDYDRDQYLIGTMDQLFNV